MPRIPVSIVTGFLGAGKTTFLNRLIATGALDRAALVINEFGDIGIDHLLIETADEGIVELSGGCLCCSLRGDLADTLSRLAARDPAPDRIVIETTGLADPGPIAQTVIANSELNQHLELAGILALIDCADGPDLLEAYEEARCQIAMADLILKTKCDAKDPSSRLDAMVQDINPVAPVMDTALDKLTVNWLHSTSPVQHPTPPHIHSDIKAIALSSPSPIPLPTIELFLETLRQICGSDLLRVKGLVRTAQTPDQPLLIQGVGQSFDTPRRLPHWPDGDTTTRLVIIGQKLEEQPIRRLFDSLAGQPVTDIPDRQALDDSPLSVPGFV